MEELTALHINMTGFTGGSKVPHQWCIDPTHVGPTIQFFSHQIFSHFLKLYPTDYF